GAQVGELLLVDAPDEARRVTRKVERPVAGDDELDTGEPACLDRGLDALLGREPGGDERVGPAAGARALGEVAHDVADDVRVVERHVQGGHTIRGGLARDNDHVGMSDEWQLIRRQGERVRRRFEAARPAAVQPNARPGLHALAADAVLAARVEARPDGADEAIVVQVQHRACADVAGGVERARPEARVQVVRVDDARTRAPDRDGDVLGVEAAAQQPARGPCATELRGVALEQLGLLAELLAHERHQLLNGPLLAAWRAVAVVEKQDQVGAKPRLRGGYGLDGGDHHPHPWPGGVSRARTRVYL